MVITCHCGSRHHIRIPDKKKEKDGKGQKGTVESASFKEVSQSLSQQLLFTSHWPYL